MNWISAAAQYNENQPFTSDVNKFTSSAVAPTWFTFSNLHVAKVTKVGPYADPNQMFTVSASQLLLEFEAPQPPAGTLQAQLFPRPHWYAILDINRIFVTPANHFYRFVDPMAAYAPGDKVAVWFSITSPAVIIGKYRPPSGPGAAQPTNGPMPGIVGFQ